VSIPNFQSGHPTRPAQDHFLSDLLERQVRVYVFLVNGIRLTGTVVGFDNFIVILAAGGMQQIVNKHSIATITRGERKSVRAHTNDERFRPKEVRAEPSKLRVSRAPMVKSAAPKARVG